MQPVTQGVTPASSPACDGQFSLPGVVPVSSPIYSAVVFDVSPSGFVAYVNHKPVAWAFKGQHRGIVEGHDVRCFFVDLAYVFQSGRTARMDQECFEFSYGTQPATRAEAFDVLMTRARDFVIDAFRGKVAGGEA